uniref:Serpentine receptor class gamma n=1 Tax=Strongyloides venezuelensis TaxID=75913 RepID=A0A0K0FCI1_STRVS
MNNVILSIITFICSVISIVLNIVTLRKYTEIMKKTPVKERSKRLLMLLYMIVTTLCLFALSIEQFVRLYFGIVNDKEGIYFLTFVLYWIIPIFTILQPVVTLIMSKNLRNYFLSFYFGIFLPKSFQMSTSITYFLPTAIFSYNLFYEAEVAYVTSFDFYTFIITDEWVNLMNSSILLVTSVISAVITFTLNIVTLRKYSKVINKKKGNERSKLFLMFLYMAITTMCLILFAIERLIGLYFRIVKNNEGDYFLTFTLYWILPILTLTQPVTTLIMSKSLRKFFLSFYFKRFLPRNHQISSNFNLKTGVGVTKKTQT